MNTLPSVSRYAFDSPARYRISVQGRIPPRWCDCLEGMTVTERLSEAEQPVTTLFGDLPDQAALAGVFSTLYDLHLVVLSVERLSAEWQYPKGENQ